MAGFGTDNANRASVLAHHLNIFNVSWMRLICVCQMKRMHENQKFDLAQASVRIIYEGNARKTSSEIRLYKNSKFKPMQVTTKNILDVKN